jgi:hypothetical protein
MRYYFAAMYARHAELTGYADALEAVTDGKVVSRWHREVTPGLDNSFDAAFLATHPDQAWEHAQRDLEDLSNADAIVSFTGIGGRGGRHVEHGVAIVMTWGTEEIAGGDFRLIVVGPREHVFHCHPATEVYPDFAAFLEHETVAAGADRA